MNDTISRQAAIEEAKKCDLFLAYQGGHIDKDTLDDFIESIVTQVRNGIAKAIESLSPADNWTPVSERTPGENIPVNITWVNRFPAPYYDDIKGCPFTATGIYHNEQWYWYSCVCEDYLAESGECEMDKMDDMIDVIAWQPLPEPYKGEMKK